MARKITHNHDDVISEKTLRMIDKSVKNLAKGLAGKPIDFNKFPELLNE
jgi:hypothetical protein